MELSSIHIDYQSMLTELFDVLETLPSTWECLDDVQKSVHNIIQQTYNNFLISQSVEKQRDEEFQMFLLSSLEDIVMAFLHEHIFGLICTQFQAEDEMIYKKSHELSTLKVTADQLGALEDYAIPLPAAVSIYNIN